MHEWVEMIATVAQAGAVVAAGWVGISGLKAWKRQLVGTKRIELAEETLIAVNKWLATMEALRSPLMFVQVDPPSDRTKIERIRRRARLYLASVDRFEERHAMFDELGALKVRCSVHFDHAVASHLSTLISVNVQLLHAAALLRGLIEEGANAPEELASIEQQHSSVLDQLCGNEAKEVMQSARDAIAEIRAQLEPELR